MPSYRILHCLRAPVGGLFRHVRDLAREQARQGHAVGLICDATATDALTDRHLEDLAPELELGIAKLPMPREVGIGDVAAVAATRRLAAAMRADVLHGHGAKGGAYARLAAHALSRRGASIATFYTPHGGSLHYSRDSLKGRIFMGLEQRLARITSGLLFESAYAARTYAAHVGTPMCPTRIVHNGLRPDELLPVPSAPGAADFVFVGELRHLKGVDVLLEAFARLDCGPRRMVIVGAGPDADTFRMHAKALGIDDAVSFPGAMPARQAFALGRILVMPSRAESLPYVALEAAGAGLPVILSDVGGVPEIVDGTDTALVPAGDVAALAAAMRRALADPDAATARAERLRHAIATRFSVSTMAGGITAFYAEGFAATGARPRRAA